MSENQPSLIRRRRVQLAMAAGVCALLLSGTVQTSQFIADNTVTHTADPVTTIGSGQALLDNQPFGALVGLPPGATMQDMLDFSSKASAGPVTGSIAEGNNSNGSTPAAGPAPIAGLTGGSSGAPASASSDESDMPLLLASAESFSGNIGGRSFGPAVNYSSAGSPPRQTIADGTTIGGAGTGGQATSSKPENSGDPNEHAETVADITKPDTNTEQPATIARIAEENSGSEGGLESLLEPQGDGNGAAGGPAANIVADVPEPNSLWLLAAGLVALTMVSGFRRRR